MSFDNIYHNKTNCIPYGLPYIVTTLVLILLGQKLIKYLTLHCGYYMLKNSFRIKHIIAQHIDFVTVFISRVYIGQERFQRLTRHARRKSLILGSTLDRTLDSLAALRLSYLSKKNHVNSYNRNRLGELFSCNNFRSLKDHA